MTCLFAFVLAALGTIVSISTQAKPVAPVAAAALEKLLPSVDGWTRGAVRTDQIVISPDAKYSYASVTFTKDDFRVKVTLADTGFMADSLMALATMVMTMPEGFSSDVQGAAIKRTQVTGSQAAELWDGPKSNGEITIVVGGRFVAKVEATKIDSLETLRGVIGKVNLAALAAAK